MKLSENRYGIIGIVFFLLLFCWLGAKEFRKEKDILHNGVYVIGKVTSAKNVKGGTKIEAWYRYGKRLHVVKNTPENRFNFYVEPGTRIILQLLPDDPEIFSVVTYMKVPHCLDNDKSMDTVWQEFPACYSAPPPEAREGIFFDSSLIAR